MTNPVPTMIRRNTSRKCEIAELANLPRKCFARSGLANATVARPINHIPASTTIAPASVFINSMKVSKMRGRTSYTALHRRSSIVLTDRIYRSSSYHLSANALFVKAFRGEVTRLAANFIKCVAGTRDLIQGFEHHLATEQSGDLGRRVGRIVVANDDLV